MQFGDQPTEHHEAIARGQDVAERWRLAIRDGLSLRVLEILISAPDEDVRMVVAMNGTVPTNVLVALGDAHPELIPVIATNANAPASLKKQVSVLEQSDLSPAKFLDDVEATVEERLSLTKAVRVGETAAAVGSGGQKLQNSHRTASG